MLDAEDLQMGINKLSENLQQMILNKQCKFKFAEDVQRLMNLPPELRQQELFSKKELDAFNMHSELQRRNWLLPFMKENGVIAKLEGLMTAEIALSMPSQICLNYLLDRVEGLIALREKLITPEHLTRVNSEIAIDYLLTPSGITALHEKLLTIDDALALEPAGKPNSGRLQVLLSEKGLLALREKLITPQEAMQTKSGKDLNKLIDDKAAEVAAKQERPKPF